jgi:hypothetical protein
MNFFRAKHTVTDKFEKDKNIMITEQATTMINKCYKVIINNLKYRTLQLTSRSCEILPGAKRIVPDKFTDLMSNKHKCRRKDNDDWTQKNKPANLSGNSQNKKTFLNATKGKSLNLH